MLGRRVLSRKRLRVGTAAGLFADFMAGGDTDQFVPEEAVEHLNAACWDLQESAQDQRGGYAQMRREAKQCITRIKRNKRRGAASNGSMGNGDSHGSKHKKKKKSSSSSNSNAPDAQEQ